MILLATWISVAVVALILYLRQAYSVLSNVGVNHLPVVPIFGNNFKVFFKLEHFTKTLMSTVTAYPKDKIIGMYQMLNPIYIINDLETLKKITIKDFEHFVDRSSFVSKHDPLFGKSLLNLTGDDWKEMRSTLSPAFTSSKIRLMVPFMVEVGKEMVKVQRKKLSNSADSYIDVELKDLTARWANDVIATCAFGLKVESQSADNEFYLRSREVTNFTFFKILKIFLFVSFPRWVNLLRIGNISAPETSSFFQDVVLSTMKYRDENNIIRNDMIHILNEAKKGNLTHEKVADTDSATGFATVEESAIGKKTYNKEWSDDELVAQAILFLVAGFDTVSTVMSFGLLEVAHNPDVQQRLVNEIKEQDAKNGGKFDFNSIQSMKYLDMFVSEVLRLYPGAPFLDRQCVKDYNVGKINDSSDKDLIFRRGARIGLPFWSFHRNPELFPDPYKFDPERFSDENKHKIQPHSYMPFGLGPRNCIGSRFALCEMKVLFYQLLREIEVFPSKKTPYPPELESGFVMTIKNGGWVRFKTRQ